VTYLGNAKWISKILKDYLDLRILFLFGSSLHIIVNPFYLKKIGFVHNSQINNYNHILLYSFGCQNQFFSTNTSPHSKIWAPNDAFLLLILTSLNHFAVKMSNFIKNYFKMKIHNWPSSLWWIRNSRAPRATCRMDMHLTNTSSLPNKITENDDYRFGK